MKTARPRPDIHTLYARSVVAKFKKTVESSLRRFIDFKQLEKSMAFKRRMDAARRRKQSDRDAEIPQALRAKKLEGKSDAH